MSQKRLMSSQSWKSELKVQSFFLWQKSVCTENWLSVTFVGNMGWEYWMSINIVATSLLMPGKWWARPALAGSSTVSTRSGPSRAPSPPPRETPLCLDLWEKQNNILASLVPWPNGKQLDIFLKLNTSGPRDSCQLNEHVPFRLFASISSLSKNNFQNLSLVSRNTCAKFGRDRLKIVATRRELTDDRLRKYVHFSSLVKAETSLARSII